MEHRLQFVVNKQGKRVAVILDLPSYESLLEDLDDLRTIAERRNEPSIPLREFEARLKRRGLV